MLVLEILFSNRPTNGFIIKNKKYSSDVDCPIMVNGGSTGLVAAHVIVMNVATIAQNTICMIGRKAMDRTFEVWVKGAVIRIITDSTRAMVPPSLLGMDRRIP